MSEDRLRLLHACLAAIIRNVFVIFTTTPFVTIIKQTNNLKLSITRMIIIMIIVNRMFS